MGAGGLGHPAIAGLADLDVDLTLFDDDRVEQSNLHRLPFANDGDVGQWKLEVAQRVLSGERATLRSARRERVLPVNALEALAGHDLVIEGADNYPSKFLVADACALLGIPSVHGAALGWTATILVTQPFETACYRCVFETPPEGEALNCASAGIFAPVATLAGALMAVEAARWISGDRTNAGTILSIDGWRGRARSIHLRRRPDCPLCGIRAIRSLREDLYVAQPCDA